MKKWEKFSREELEQIVKSSSSKKEIAEKIGYRIRGDYAQKIDEMIAFYNFSIEHLHGNLNLVGRRFGLLEVVGIAPTKNGRKMWYCNCDCGT